MTTGEAVLSFFMGLVAFAACKVVERVWYSYRVPQDQARWQEELSIDLSDAIGAYLHAAEAEQRIAEKLGRMPEHFIPPTFKALRLGPLAERAVLQEAERRGLVAPGQFAELDRADPPSIELPPLQAPPAPPAPPSIELPPLQASPAPAPEAPALAWDRGQLVPRLRRVK